MRNSLIKDIFKKADHKPIEKSSVIKHISALFILTFSIGFIQSYVYKKSIDLGGDNAFYYMAAKSISEDFSYRNTMSPERKKTNAFPPGYPFLMSIVMQFTDSIDAQKVFNNIIFIISCYLFYFIIYLNSKDVWLSLIAAILIGSNYLILQFSTIMMSESSFILFSTLSFFALFKLKKTSDFVNLLKDPYLYLLIFSSSFAYHIRTQGISLIIAFVVAFLIQRKWKHSLIYTFGFIVLALPWIIRNKLLNIDATRYFNQVFAVNHWRPEEGTMSISEMIKRVFKTTEMLIAKAIPDSLIPNYVVDYKSEVTLNSWVLGIILLTIILFGLWMFFKKDKWFIILYIFFSCGIITLWSAPSANRYITTLIPLLQIGIVTSFFIGIKWLFNSINIKLKSIAIAVTFLIILFPSIFKDLKDLNKLNSISSTPAFRNYFTLAKLVKQKYPEGNVVVSSRKPSLFHLYSGSYSVGFKYSLDNELVIRDLFSKDVDYVVVDQLGYSSTGRYLMPAIQNNRQLFSLVTKLDNPETYLLKFHKERAKLLYRDIE